MNKEEEKPTMEKYGWQSSTSFEEESGWMFEGWRRCLLRSTKKMGTTNITINYFLI